MGQSPGGSRIDSKRVNAQFSQSLDPPRAASIAAPLPSVIVVPAVLAPLGFAPICTVVCGVVVRPVPVVLVGADCCKAATNAASTAEADAGVPDAGAIATAPDGTPGAEIAREAAEFEALSSNATATCGVTLV